jgi:hypothetical protein
MTVEIGAEAVQFPEKEYISEISVAVHIGDTGSHRLRVSVIQGVANLVKCTVFIN